MDPLLYSSSSSSLGVLFAWPSFSFNLSPASLSRAYSLTLSSTIETLFMHTLDGGVTENGTGRERVRWHPRLGWGGGDESCVREG